VNRRSFLAALAGTAGGLVLPDPDARRVYSFPSVPTVWSRMIWDELRRRSQKALNAKIGKPMINGVVYDWASIEFRIDGKFVEIPCTTIEYGGGRYDVEAGPIPMLSDFEFECTHSLDVGETEEERT
jgi:hypothetical protein